MKQASLICCRAAPAALAPSRSICFNARSPAAGHLRATVVSRPASRRRAALVRARAGDAPGNADEPQTFALAPSQPKSPTGEMAAYYLQMQPHLFREAVEGAFQRIREQRDADAASAAAADQQQPPSSPSSEGSSAADSGSSSGGGGVSGGTDGGDLVLYRRMAEVKRLEQMLAIEDLMYVCILEKFQGIGVDMLPRVEPIEESASTLKALTEGVHSREAVDMVKEHVLAVLGPASMAFANTMIKMSKLQAAQVYAASIMFGYFLRRVDTRFQLSKQLGVLPEDREDAVARLERLFSQADTVDAAVDPDSAPLPGPHAGAAAAAADQPSTPAPGSDQAQEQEQQRQAAGLMRRPKSALRRYVESFDQETMLETARLVNLESAQLVERQTKALFGDIKALQRDMQEAVGQDASSMEEIMQRVQQAVADGKVESVTMTVGTQRRAVLEAVAYGCFLRDVESWVDNDYELLTPVGADGGMMEL